MFACRGINMSMYLIIWRSRWLDNIITTTLTARFTRNPEPRTLYESRNCLHSTNTTTKEEGRRRQCPRSWRNHPDIHLMWLSRKYTVKTRMISLKPSPTHMWCHKSSLPAFWNFYHIWKWNLHITIGMYWLHVQYSFCNDLFTLSVLLCWPHAQYSWFCITFFYF